MTDDEILKKIAKLIYEDSTNFMRTWPRDLLEAIFAREAKSNKNWQRFVKEWYANGNE